MPIFGGSGTDFGESGSGFGRIFGGYGMDWNHFGLILPGHWPSGRAYFEPF